MLDDLISNEILQQILGLSVNMKYCLQDSDQAIFVVLLFTLQLPERSWCNG